MTTIALRCHQAGATNAANIMTDEETEFFITYVQAGWDKDTGKSLGRRYFRPDGSLIAQILSFEKPDYDRMEQAGEFNIDSSRTGGMLLSDNIQGTDFVAAMEKVDGAKEDGPTLAQSVTSEEFQIISGGDDVFRARVVGGRLVID